MKDPQLTIETDLTDLSPNDWFAQIDDICEDFGFFEQLGCTHFAGFLEAGNKLLVTFENVEDIRAHNPDAEPRGFAYARHDGWSHLAIFSMSRSWFRDRAVYDFFDRLSDDAFFEDFETVVFHGANECGYAAAAFSVVAPGATVIALSPQATLDASVAGWDHRYRAHRRLDFQSRYGYAPDMVEGADAVFIAYDPHEPMDAIHAGLFRNSNVALMPAPLLGRQLARSFDRMGIHDVMIKLAMDGSLDKKRFAQLLRARRYDEPYMRNLTRQLVAQGHRDLACVICEYMLRRGQNAFFTKTLSGLRDKSAA
ncbi:phosphoadenosine phosphosulfate reductase [Yoonia sp. SS1-5]|uniref:Phosphoadenosine phosphosulfate reductase n=1 Tax=Yoonia rhodophyticola TaxID=3137370 RepID=A0AAN0M7M9_9RHOB